MSDDYNCSREISCTCGNVLDDDNFDVSGDEQFEFTVEACEDCLEKAVDDAKKEQLDDIQKKAKKPYILKCRECENDIDDFDVEIDDDGDLKAYIGLCDHCHKEPLEEMRNELREELREEFKANLEKQGFYLKG